MSQNNTTPQWETRTLNVKQWRKFNSRWYQVVIVDRNGNERKMIMKEVKEFKGEGDENSL